MKTTKLVLVALAFAVPVLLHAQEQSTAPAQAKVRPTESDNLTPLQRARKYTRIKGNRKIDLKAVKQTEGIKTGMVIAYGHLIPPPYKVESIEGKVFINGIQVVPSLVAQREIKPVEIPADRKARYQKMIQFEKEISRKYYSEVVFKDKAKLQAEILAFAKQNELVKDAHWGTDMLVIDYKVGAGSMVTLRGTTPEKPWPSRKKETGEAAVQYITKGIESGCIIMDSDGGMGHTCADKQTVNEIMQDPRLSKEEKIERLAKWGNYEAAMDIADNYEPQEWKVEEAQK